MSCAHEHPARTRGVIALVEENCTSCMLCVRECPDWCIEIQAHKETVEVPGARARQQNVLDSFTIDFGLCMYCGICVEVCPFDALFWAPNHDYAAGTPSELVQGRAQLRDWVAAAPAPEPLDDAAAPPKVGSGRRSAAPGPARANG